MVKLQGEPWQQAITVSMNTKQIYKTGTVLILLKVPVLSDFRLDFTKNDIPKGYMISTYCKHS